MILSSIKLISCNFENHNPLIYDFIEIWNLKNTLFVTKISDLLCSSIKYVMSGTKEIFSLPRDF